MGKIIKYLKEYSFLILIIIGLLFVQAYTDLALPGYTSKIVDIGIQQGGIESTLPDVLREQTYHSLQLFMGEEDSTLFSNSYELISKDSLNDSDLKKYEKNYPIINTENLYVLKEVTQEDAVKLEGILQSSFLVYSSFTSESEYTDKMKTEMVKNLPDNMKDLPLIDIVAAMPAEQRMELVTTMNENMLIKLPESIQYQSAIAQIKAEYIAIGIDVEGLQSNYIVMAGIKMLLLAFLGMGITIIVGFLAAKISSGFAKKLRFKVFDKILGYSNLEFDKFSTASLITRSTNDIQQVEMSIGMILRMVIYAPILAIGGIIKVLNTNVSMSWIIALAVVVIMIVMGALLMVAMPKFKLIQKLVDRLNLVSREILTGLSVIRAFGKEDHEEARFEVANKDIMKTNLFINRTMNFMMPALTIIMNGIVALILWKGAEGIDLGTMQVGDIMAFITYSMQIIMSFLMLSMLTFILPRAEVSATRIVEVLETSLSVTDKENTTTMLDSKKGYVEFDNVSFRYPNAEDDVLSDISFTAKPGETVAIIGSTGSGKSTLVNLIPRFYDVTEGVVKVGGVDIRDLNQKDLRDAIGYVPQKAVLFSGTIDSNIKYGKEDISEEQVRTASRIAQASSFIEEKDDKYNTPISQGGSNVSGGQKQRLSIARAIAKEPKIYIFDDSFSALDYKTDVALRKAIHDEINDSTVIIVAQRISTIMHADQILVLDDGKVVGRGTHKELLKTCDAYMQIASSQLSKEELAYE